MVSGAEEVSETIDSDGVTIVFGTSTISVSTGDDETDDSIGTDGAMVDTGNGTDSTTTGGITIDSTILLSGEIITEVSCIGGVTEFNRSTLGDTGMSGIIPLFLRRIKNTTTHPSTRRTIKIPPIINRSLFDHS